MDFCPLCGCDLDTDEGYCQDCLDELGTYKGELSEPDDWYDDWYSVGSCEGTSMDLPDIFDPDE